MADQGTTVGVVGQGAVIDQWKLQAPQGATPTSFEWTPGDVSASTELKHELPSEQAIAQQRADQAAQGATPTTFDY
jgi:hypothetical protein